MIHMNQMSDIENSNMGSNNETVQKQRPSDFENALQLKPATIPGFVVTPVVMKLKTDKVTEEDIDLEDLTYTISKTIKHCVTHDKSDDALYNEHSDEQNLDIANRIITSGRRYETTMPWLKYRMQFPTTTINYPKTK